MSEGRKWSSVSVHIEYIRKLRALKSRHKRSFTSIVELLIDRALADPSLLVPPEGEPVVRVPGASGSFEGSG